MFGKSDDTTTGAQSVKKAVSELQGLKETDFFVELGEPTIVQNGGEFFHDSVVAVPVKDSPYNTVNRLVFEVPVSPDQEDNAFLDLLALFELKFEEMEYIDGKTVPLTFLGGNAAIQWDRLMDETEADSDNGQDAESDDSLGVSVEETTVTADAEADD